ncbi:FAD-dependent oxidoreductase [Methylobacterium soli]|uniref:Mercuric reductase n=1 Tax=Methylobacterium soli TaxID=553447 RepID=A0A6L3SQ22_9HYPH|nr:FAD-dependent oxidoreductase [Methylobacterium soli]KAB1072709.1 mercuric reductase [Methylobacterium soli]GJE43718.1 putative pyridine nucleotide-disulfide oxidoreductase RclA [Methylobacterium soli]
MSATEPSFEPRPSEEQPGSAEARAATPPEHFDVLILGSGQGGKLLAWHLGHAGRRVAVVERRWVGGSCPNIACLPSKNEIWSAKVAHLVRNAARFGTITGPVTTDMEAVRQRKRAMVEGEVAFHLKAYGDAGVDLVMGSGRLVAPKTLEVRLNDGGTRVLTGDQVFLNLGTHATIPAIPGLAEAGPLTHIETLELDAVPAHLIVLGGGYVGLEMAQALGRFGSRVTILQIGPQILSNEDADVAAEMQQILAAEDIKVITGAETLSVTGRSGQAVSLVVRTGEGERTIEGSHILVAAGRTPNTQGIGLEEAGVALTDRGFIRVNERLETSAPGVWALGEAAGSPQFTHVSVDDFRIIRDNLAGGQRSTQDRLVPANMFTEPPLARVGLNEREAQRQSVPVRVARLPMSAVLRTQTTGETQGFMKALVGDDDHILGFTMIGSEAGEVVAVVQTAMLAGLPYQRLRDAVLAHPTMAEGLGPLFAGVPPQSL